MAAYRKSQPPHLDSYETGRTYSENSFPFAGPSYVSQSAIPASTTVPVYQNGSQMTHMAYASSQARPYDDQAGPYLNVGSTPIPEVTSYAPSKGSHGTKVYVNITSLYELLTSNSPIFFLTFGQRKCPASLSKMSQQGAVCQYTVATEVPQFSATNYASQQVPVFMFIETGDGDIVAKIDVGHFTYLDSVQQENHGSAAGTRKRKISTESAEALKSPAKRISNQQLRPKEEYNSYGYTPTEVAPYSPFLQPGATSYDGLMPPYSRSASSYQHHPSARQMPYGYSSSTASPTSLKAQSPQNQAWSSAYSTMTSNMVRSPGVALATVTSRSALSSLPSPAIANPPLFRTSTLHQTPSPASTPHGGHPGQAFNPYSPYSHHKAKLEITGDLEVMANNWSKEEWETKRRLVHFKRSQSGSTISATFQAVSVDNRPPNSICISCIWWAEKDTCFVTSVDTIYLLEQLVAARFTVEEKNRIRRNLEGFRPLTVSKGKPDSEEFFKVIMAFPTPKPRNIEKDVKVFHWKDLASALKKIISKYSASPSSTLPPAPSAPALLTPVSSTGYATEGSSAGMSYASGHHGALSPRSLSGSTSSTVYGSNNPARVVSPHSAKSMTSGDLRVSVAHTPLGHETASTWQSGQYQLSGEQPYAQLGSHSQNHTRGSWDMTGYGDQNAAVTAGGTCAEQHQPLSSSNNSSNNNNHNTISYAASRNTSVADSAVGGGERNNSSLSTRKSHPMPR